MTSLRRQLVAWLLPGVAVAFAVAGLIVHATVTRALETQFDAALAATAGGLGALLEYDGEHVEFSFAADAMPEFRAGPKAEYYALWFRDGALASHSASAGSDSLPRRSGPADRPEFWDLPLPDGRPGRAVGMDVPAYAKDAPESLAVADLPVLTIVVARSRAPLEAGRSALALGLLAAGGVTLLLTWLGVMLAVRRGLQPLHRLNAQVEQMDATSLSRRVPVEGVPEELTASVVKLNELFARLQGAFEKERRMTAAMAHELRTPVAELRSASDVAQRWPEDEELSDALGATAADVAQRMGAVIDALMRYCRLEAGQASARREVLGVRDLMEAQWAPHERVAARRGVSLVNEVPSSLSVVSDPGLLAIVFANVLGNAAHHASVGQVRAHATSEAGSVVIHVANDTDELHADDLARVTEPFWRKEAARTDDRHSGLGLTLVASVAEVIGCDVRFRLAGRQFIVSVGLPVDAAAGRCAAPEPQPAGRA